MIEKLRAPGLATLGRLLLAAILTSPLLCQFPGGGVSSGDGITPAMLAPGTPAGSYELSGFDTVNIPTGHVNFTIPLAEAYGRNGMKVPLVWNQQGQWTAYAQPAECNNPAPRYCSTWTVVTAYGPRYSFSANFGGFLETRTIGANCIQGTANYPDNIYWLQSLTTIYYVAPDGTETEFVDTATGGAIENNTGYSGPFTNRGTTFRAVDGSGSVVNALEAVVDNPDGCAAGALPVGGTMILRDGTQYTFYDFSNSQGYGGYAQQIQDRNGNTIEVTAPWLYNPGTGEQITDALNRSITASSVQYSPPDSRNRSSAETVTYPGYGGAQRQVIISHACTTQETEINNGNGPFWTCGQSTAPNAVTTASGKTRYLFRNDQESSCNEQLFTFSDTEGPLGIDLPFEIVLPDGNTYEIYYDCYGNVSRVELPTGGAYEYDYEIFSSGSQGPQPWYDATAPTQYSISPFLIQKRVYGNISSLGSSSGATLEQVICYTSPFPAGAPDSIQTVTVSYSTTSTSSPEGCGSSTLGSENHTFYEVNTSPNTETTNVPIPGWEEGRETQVSYYDASGNPLKTENTFWQQRACYTSLQFPLDVPCWFLTSQDYTATTCTGTTNNVLSPACPSHDPQIEYQTTAYYGNPSSNSVVSEEAYTYDPYNNRTSVTEYGYGSGAPGSIARATTTCYDAWTSVCPVSVGNYSAYTAGNVNIVNLPLVQQVSSSNGGSVVAQTQWSYDGSTTSCAGITGHNSGYNTSYNPRGNATSITQLWLDPVNGNRRNLVTTQSFDLAGNMVSTLDPRGVRQDLVFADSGGFCVAPISRIHYQLPNPTSNLSCTVTSSGCLVEQFTYDYDILKPTSYVDFNGNRTTLAYSDPWNLDRLTNITKLADGGQINYTYTDTPTSLTNSNGCSVGNQSTTCFTVNAKQDLTTPGDGLINSQTDYDGLGRKALTWYMDGPVNGTQTEIDTQYTYDGKNRPYTVSNPGNVSQVTTYNQYDVLDRPLKVTAQDGSVSSYVYYGDTGTLTNTKLAIEPSWNTGTGNGNNRLYFSDALGRLVQVNENQTSWQGGNYGQSGPSTYTTTYGYDVLDDLTGVSQSGQSRSFTYDSLKRLVEAVNPETGPVKYSYDSSGNLSTRTDYNGSVTTYSAYDGMNRVTGKSYTLGTAPGTGVAATPPVTYCYDFYNYNTQSCATAASGGGTNMKGRLTQVTAASSPPMVNDYTSYYWTGQALSNIQITAGLPYQMSYSYDLAGKLTSFTFPSGRQQSMTYDTAARPSNVSGTYGTTTTNYAGAFAWFPNGALKSVILGPNLPQQYCQDLLGRLQIVTVRLGPPGGSTTTNCANNNDLLNLKYTYGAQDANNGNVTAESILPLNVNQIFTYDAYDRIATAQETPSGGGTSAWSQNYGYDAFGNRWVSVNAGTQPFQLSAFTPSTSSWFNSNNQLSNPSLPTGYDNAGNLKSIGTYSYSYDAEERQAIVTIGGPANTYSYDGEGRRVQKITSNGTTTYVYDAMGKVAAEYTSNPPPEIATLYLTQDPLGSTRLVTTSAGVPTSCHDYLPFGEELLYGMDGRGSCYPTTTGSTADAVTHKFTDKEQDTETASSATQANDFFGARNFSGAMGRYSSPDWSTFPDPIPFARLEDPQTLNLYAYVRNDPLGGADPDGHDGCKGGKDPTGNPCWTITIKGQQDKPRSSADDQQKFLAALPIGHHFMVLTRQMPRDNLAYQFFNRWTTGPLANPSVNRYDWLHRLYNSQVKEILGRYLERTGKSLDQLDEGDLKAIADNVRNAGGSAQEFLDRLYKFNPNAGPISDNIDAIMNAARDAFSRLWQTLGPVAEEVEGVASQVAEAYESTGLPPP